MKRKLSLLLCFAFLCCVLTGCGGSKAENMSADEGYFERPSQEGEIAPGKDASLTGNSTLDTTDSIDRKLIKIVHIDAESQNYDELLVSLNETINTLGGYVEHREQYNRNRRACDMTIRIPAASLNRFIEQVNADANVISSTETATDVTLEYADTETKVAALETEQTRLLELLAKAETIQDILEIEGRLGDVTYELERHASRLRSLANQVNYATVYLTLREVTVLTPKEDPTVWQRITTGFAESVSDLCENITDVFVWLIVESPNLVIWALILGLIWNLRKHLKKRKNKQPAPPPQQSE